MRLAESQAHQPFPGFFEPGFFYLCHRCKELFQAVLQDSNLFLPRVIPKIHPFRQKQLLPKQKFRLFCKNKYHKFSSAVLLVLPDLRNSAFFIYRVNDERRCRNCTSAFLRSKGDEKNAVSSKAYPCALHDGGLCAAVSRRAARRCRLYKICAMQGLPVSTAWLYLLAKRR